MSEPKRYGHKAIIYPKSDDDTYITVPIQEADGQWVSYMDYCRLKAEVERMTKAGDAMYYYLLSNSKITANQWEVRQAWDNLRNNRPTE